MDLLREPNVSAVSSILGKYLGEEPTPSIIGAEAGTEGGVS
jgi:hypothetical protein